MKIDLVSTEKIPILPFESNMRKRLRQIYGVLYFMIQNNDFTSSVHQTLKLFPEVKDYQTIADKCGRGFAGSVEKFEFWCESGEILNNLLTKFSLSDSDFHIFNRLLHKHVSDIIG